MFTHSQMLSTYHPEHLWNLSVPVQPNHQPNQISTGSDTVLGSAYAKIIKALGHRTSILGYAPTPVQELIFPILFPHLPLLVHTTLTQTLPSLLPTRCGQNLCFSDAPTACTHSSPGQVEGGQILGRSLWSHFLALWPSAKSLAASGVREQWRRVARNTWVNLSEME